MDLKRKKIFVGLSGGVDSAVSAALLQKAGADVTGVFIKGWYPPGMPCTWAAERRDAMRVAARLHIPFRTLDASAEYKKGVIEYLVSEYRAGRTPNPDVMCNREVKFGAFYRFAREAGADAIATGHYARLADEPSTPRSLGEVGSVRLLRGSDMNKDQSYFLWAVPKDVLEEAVFPVGHMEKEDVRALARRFNLPVAEKRDSQGVCFLGSISVEEFLKSQFGVSPGRATDEDGRLVGEHDGVLLHTLGERVALGGAIEPGPWFVLAKDIAGNVLVVGKTRTPDESDVRRDIRFTDANWFKEPGGVTEAQYRYRGPRVPGHIEKDRFVCTALLPEIPTPGQSIVFYRDDELVGGGIIVA